MSILNKFQLQCLNTKETSDNSYVNNLEQTSNANQAIIQRYEKKEHVIGNISKLLSST